MFHREYERLLPEDDYEALDGHSYEVMEYVYGLLENGADIDALPEGDGEQIAYHSHTVSSARSVWNRTRWRSSKTPGST